MSLRLQRLNPDLIQLIVDLQNRVQTLETAKRLGNASVDNGELIVKGGDITVRSSVGNLVTKVSHGTSPTIQYFPGDLISSPDRTSMFSWRPDGNAALQLSVENNTTGAQDGGKLLLQKDRLYLSVQPNVGNEAYMSIGVQGSEIFRFQGKWGVNNQVASSDGIVFGQSAISAGFGAASFAFTYPFTNTPIVLYSLQDAGAMPAHGLSAVSNSGFTVTWAAGTTAKFISWVAFRV